MKIKIKKINIDVCKVKAGIKTDTELAQKTSLSRYTLRKYRDPNKFGNITIEKLMDLCNVLQCRFEELVEFEYEE